MSAAAIRMPLADAVAIATHLVAELEPFCDQIIVAGSIRRGALDVGDIELVVIPRSVVPEGVVQAGLFGESAPVSVGQKVNMLTEHLGQLEAAGTIRRRADKNGRPGGLNRIVWRIDGGEVAVDLFRAVPSTLGAVLALRTGPAAFSKRLVTAIAAGGVRPNDMQFDKGYVWRYSRLPDGTFGRRVFVPTPTEEALFAELGLPYVAPEERTAETFERGRR